LHPDAVILWLPRADEHELAASLGLCECDPALLRDLINAAQDQVARDLPGTSVRVHRWHVWRVVRAMHRCGVLNTPDGRARAYTWLATNPSGPTGTED
jgi:hypothetical protein